MAFTHVLRLALGLASIQFAMSLAGDETGRRWITQTIVGTGEKGYAGDSGPALAAKLNNPFGITRGPDGALYVVEFDGNVVRRWGADGVITTVAGSGKKGGEGTVARLWRLNSINLTKFDSIVRAISISLIC